MKVLIFYTSYRQFKELDYQVRFLERCPKLISQSDMLWVCNNISIPTSKLEEKLSAMPFRKKKLVHKDLNKGGYYRGQFEVLASQEETVLDYDFVIHLHPDIYFADENLLLKLLDQYKNFKVGFLASRIFGNNSLSFSTDFFIYRPKFLPHNFFLSCLNSDFSLDIGAEFIFYSKIQELKVPCIELSRFVLGHYHRDIDEFGMWHEHQLLRVDLFFQHPSLRHTYTIYQCVLNNQRLFARVARNCMIRFFRGEKQDGFLKQLSGAGERPPKQQAALLD